MNQMRDSAGRSHLGKSVHLVDTIISTKRNAHVIISMKCGNMKNNRNGNIGEMNMAGVLGAETGPWLSALV